MFTVVIYAITDETKSANQISTYNVKFDVNMNRFNYVVKINFGDICFLKRILCEICEKVLEHISPHL